MAPQGMLQAQLIMYSFLLLLFFLDTAASTRNPGCPNMCGNLTITYPFGIGEGCYFAKQFEVTCNDSINSAYLEHFGRQVLGLSDSDVRINYFPVIRSQFNRSSGLDVISFPQVSLGPYFAFPRDRNKLVAVACDVCVYILDNKQRVITGCMSLCSATNSNSFLSSSCSDGYCCENAIPDDLTDFTIWVHSMTLYKRSPDACDSYYVAEKDFNGIKKSTSMLNCGEGDSQVKEFIPVILEWAVGNTSCERAQRRSGYACQENSSCVEAAGGVGYRCLCKTGYQGNPYIQQGCQDVDECSTKTHNCQKKDRCVNIDGSYQCEARHPYMPVYLGTALAIALLILVAVILRLSRERNERMDKKAKKKCFKRNGGLLLQQHIASSRESTPEIKLFVREDLEKATDNFNENRILGKGGFGTVYKGMLADGSIVAVKKSNIVDEKQVSQFINEVFILSQISHRHIVKLLGCCLETEVPLLVYEYISNGTLSHHLHDEPNIPTISWENRLRIATEVAGALAYLHSCVSTSIFHRDIKSTNILLDENYRAVISDFGLSRSVPINKTHLTTLVGGTFGYLDPEYFQSGQLNDRSDVYAFGVVLAELVTGRTAISSNTDEGLVLHFRSAVKENYLFKVVEKRIVTESKEDEIVAVGKLAKRCLKLTARKRPCMKEVAAELEGMIRIKEDLVRKQTSRDTLCSLSEKSFSCSSDTDSGDDEDTS